MRDIDNVQKQYAEILFRGGWLTVKGKVQRREAKALSVIADDLQLLVLAGYISPETSASSEEQRNKLRAELNMLLERMETTSNRIKEIVDRVLT